MKMFIILLKMFIILLATLVCIVLISLTVNALTETTFNNTKTTENITFNNNGENITRYLTIPKGSVISNASIDLKGVEYYYKQDKADVTKITQINNWTNPYNINDSSLSTAGITTRYKGETQFYVNYSIPIGINKSTSYWFVKAGTSNHQITIPDSCWNYSNTTLVLRVVGRNDNPLGVVHYKLQCYRDSNTWYNSLVYQQTTPYIYDEYMVWQKNDYYFPTNISIFYNNTLIYQNLTQITSTLNNIDLNATLLTKYFANSNIIDFDFYSSIIGKLEYSNLLINYSVPANTAVLSFDDDTAWSTTASSGHKVDHNIIVNNTGDYNATSCDVYFPGEDGFSINFSRINAGEYVVGLIENTPSSSIAGNLKISCLGTDESETVYTTNFITTAISIQTFIGGGGSTGPVTGGSCEILLYKPIQGSPIGIIGGYDTVKCVDFIYFNNDTSETKFSFKTNIDECFINTSSQILEAGGLGNNEVCCNIPIDLKEGNAIISTSSCEQSYNLYTKSNQLLGMVDLLLGSKGVGFSIFLFVIIIGTIFGGLFLLSRLQ